MQTEAHAVRLRLAREAADRPVDPDAWGAILRALVRNGRLHASDLRLRVTLPPSRFDAALAEVERLGLVENSGGHYTPAPDEFWWPVLVEGSAA